jgi:hypothetical protein
MHLWNDCKNYLSHGKLKDTILVIDGQTSHSNCLQLLEFARNNDIMIFGYILTLPSIYSPLRGHFQELQRGKLCCPSGLLFSR